jgi:hypothetical protein
VRKHLKKNVRECLEKVWELFRCLGRGGSKDLGSSRVSVRVVGTQVVLGRVIVVVAIAYATLKEGVPPSEKTLGAIDIHEID